jgi:4-hydroxybenzoate polyprenyltransferase
VPDLLRLVRAHNLLIAAVGILAGGWIALAGLAFPPALWWAVVSGVGLGAVGNVLNDIWDAPADSANHRPDRPLALGRVSRGAADLLVLWGSLLGLGAAALVNGLAVLAALAALGVMAIYSPILKRRGLPGNVAVALVAGFPLAFGALAVGVPAAGVVPWILAAVLHFGREIAKDLEDEEGDRIAGRRTLPLIVGREGARRIAAGSLVLFIPISLLLPAVAGFHWTYFVGAAVADVLVVLALGRLRRADFARASGLLKLAMPVGIAALVLGRIV